VPKCGGTVFIEVNAFDNRASLATDKNMSTGFIEYSESEQKALAILFPAP